MKRDPLNEMTGLIKQFGGPNGLAVPSAGVQNHMRVILHFKTCTVAALRPKFVAIDVVKDKSTAAIQCEKFRDAEISCSRIADITDTVNGIQPNCHHPAK
jgi:hypothetical protein